MAEREQVLQIVLDGLWSSAHEHCCFRPDLGTVAWDPNAASDPSATSRALWQDYAEQLLLRWLEYHSPSAADREQAARPRRAPVKRPHRERVKP